MRRLAAYTAVCAAFLFPRIGFARSDFVPDAPPIYFAVYEDHLLNPYSLVPTPSIMVGGSVYLRSDDIPRTKLVLKFDFRESKVSYVHDESLPESIHAFVEDTDHIFAGGDGLAVFDKKTGEWDRWSEFDLHKICDIVADDSTIWLGTSGGVLQVDPEDRAIVKRYSEADGLNADGVYSLLRVGNALLVGSYRQGRDIRYLNLERVEDIIGLGLAEIDLTSDAVKTIKIPEWTSEWPHAKTNLVIEMYGVAGQENTVKIVTWKPWDIKCWDYNHENGVFTQSENQFYQLDRVLNQYKAEVRSVLAGHIIDYIVTLGLDNWGGNRFEVVRLIWDREDFPLIKRILKSEDS